jgi:hypothetical protein
MKWRVEAEFHSLVTSAIGGRGQSALSLKANVFTGQDVWWGPTFKWTL